MWMASMAAVVLGSMWAWWFNHGMTAQDDNSAPRPSQLARLEHRFLNVRDATMRLHETALQRKKLDEQRQSLAQLTRIKEGVQLLLDALERNMAVHQECNSKEARMLERQLADTSKVLRDVLDLERHPNQPSEDWIPKLNRIRETLVKYTTIELRKNIDIQSNAMSNLDFLFQSQDTPQEA